MVDYENDEYHRKRHPEFLKDEVLGKAWAFFADIYYLNIAKNGMKVLEVGGGLGYNLLNVKDRADVYMVEPSALGRKISSEHGIVSVKGLEELTGNLFDVILCRHVLEHMEEPKAALEGIYRFLKPEGRLILIVPCEEWDAMPDENDINHHLYCWNPQTLSNLLDLVGFEVKDIRFEYYGARRKLLALYRRFGGKIYARAIHFVGRVFGFRELVLECSRPSGRDTGKSLS